MENFDFDNTQAQRDAVILYSFNADMLGASVKYLRSHIETLCKYVPTRGTPWAEDSKAVNAGTPIHDTWFQAHSHTLNLLKDKKESNHRNFLLSLSLISTLALVATLGYKVFISDQKVEALSQQVLQLRELVTKHQLQLAAPQAAPYKPPINNNSSQEESPALNKSKHSDADKAGAGV